MAKGEIRGVGRRAGWRARAFGALGLVAFAIALWSVDSESARDPVRDHGAAHGRTAQVLLEASEPSAEEVEWIVEHTEPGAPDVGTAGITGRFSLLGPGAWNGPISPYGAGQALGGDPAAALGSLMDDSTGSSFGFGGLGVIGSGRGAGGTGAAVGTVPVGPASALSPEARAEETGFLPTRGHPRSTFSVDVDSASYSNIRAQLTAGEMPAPGDVRIEEMINYFDYAYAAPSGGEAFSVTAEVGECPWNPEHRLLHVGIQGRRLDLRSVPARNVVFLVDVSGSMESPEKLPLLVSSLGMLVDRLRPIDRVSMVVYAGASGLVLPPTAGDRKEEIRAALARLAAGGSTNGEGGIQMAYAQARASFVRGGINRVILATDGDFNVGATSEEDLARLIERERRSGVFLTVLGFGADLTGDATMELLADRGNGSYAYVDTPAEAERVLVREASATLVTIAKDVKLQLVFDPARVARHRLVGYENRRLRDEEFDDDARDAGEIGAGHSVTALYEIVPASGRSVREPLGDIAVLRIRSKLPDGDESRLAEYAIRDDDGGTETSRAFRFSAAVAEFGMVLRDSAFRGSSTFSSAEALAAGAIGPDPFRDRAELLALVRRARAIAGEAGQPARTASL